MAAFRYSLPVLKIYSIRNVHCRFSVLTVNIETQPLLSFNCDMSKVTTFSSSSENRYLLLIISRHRPITQRMTKRILKKKFYRALTSRDITRVYTSSFFISPILKRRSIRPSTCVTYKQKHQEQQTEEREIQIFSHAYIRKTQQPRLLTLHSENVKKTLNFK